jgi:hypothetical protein
MGSHNSSVAASGGDSSAGALAPARTSQSLTRLLPAPIECLDRDRCRVRHLPRALHREPDFGVPNVNHAFAELLVGAGEPHEPPARDHRFTP